MSEVDGLYTVTAEDLEPAGMRCSECLALFSVGECYTHLLLQVHVEEQLVAAITEIVCLGCAAIGEVS